MTTKIEQTTNELLHFTGVGKFNVGKLKLKDDSKQRKKKIFLRANSRAAIFANWNIKSSEFAMKTHNPIRAIVDGLKITPNKEKPMIALSIGRC